MEIEGYYWDVFTILCMYYANDRLIAECLVVISYFLKCLVRIPSLAFIHCWMNKEKRQKVMRVPLCNYS